MKLDDVPALAWAGIGAALTKAVSMFFDHKSGILAEAREIRAELRAEIVQFRIDEDRLRAELAAWEKRSYGLERQFAACETETTALRAEVETLRADLKRYHDAIGDVVHK